MDRDKRWERTQQAYDMLAHGERAIPCARCTGGACAWPTNAMKTTNSSCRRSSARRARSCDGDACIFFNFRPDRARQLTLAFNHDPAVPFETVAYRICFFATMTKYDETYPNPVLFGPRPQFDTFGEIVSRAGLKQLRLAETEKYAHVTYFFNGGREEHLRGRRP